MLEAVVGLKRRVTQASSVLTISRKTVDLDMIPAYPAERYFSSIWMFLWKGLQRAFGVLEASAWACWRILGIIQEVRSIF